MKKSTRVYKRPFPWDLWLAYLVGVPCVVLMVLIIWATFVVLFSIK